MSKRSGGSLQYLANHVMVDLSPNLHLSDSGSATPVVRLVAPGLLTVGQDMSLQPELAESWSISDDRRVYRFKLREGLKFHSGRPLDAGMVAWNFEHMFDRRNVSLHADDYKYIEKVVAVDKTTVEFRLSRPFESFLQHLAWRTGIKDDCVAQPVGAGPFKLAAFHFDGYLRLVKNPDYWRTGYPLLDEIEIRFAPHADDRAKAILSGKVDYADAVPGGIIDEVTSKGLFHVHRSRGYRRQFLAFNCAEPPFNDVRVRQAVALAVDRQRIVDVAMGGNAEVAETVFPAWDQWHCPVDPRKPDREKARRLLAEAGYKPGEIDVPMVLTAVAPVPKIAECVMQDLAEIGITIRPTAYDDPPWWPFVFLRSPWKIACQGATPRTDPDIILRREYCTTGSYNAMHYSNATFDELVERASSIQDFASRKALYDQAQRIIWEEVPMLELLHGGITCGWKPSVKGFQPHPRADVSFTETYIEP